MTTDLQVGAGILQLMEAQGDEPVVDSVFINLPEFTVEIGTGKVNRYFAHNFMGAAQWTISSRPLDKPIFTDYARILQVWQYDPATQAEGTLQEVIDLALQFGFTGIAVKCLDGPIWMGAIDYSPDAINSAQQLADQADLCHQHGLKLYGWVNPLQDNWAVQADRGAACAKACDGLFIDAEPYDQFWGIAPAGRATAYMDRMRGQAPNAWLCLQPDPRPARFAEIKPEEWMAYCDALSGQHYWSTFGSTAGQEMARARELHEIYGKPVLPTIPGAAPVVSVPEDALKTFPGFVMWRVGVADPVMLTRLGQITPDVVHVGLAS